MINGKQPEKELLNSKEACRRLNVSRATLCRLTQTGRLSHYRVGKKLLFSPRHLSEFLQSTEVRAKAA